MPGVKIEEISPEVTMPISGNIEVASENVLEKYKLADMDTSGDPDYFGYTDKDGNWYIMQLTSTASRYISGVAGTYIANWTGRTGLSYDYFYNIF